MDKKDKELVRFIRSIKNGLEIYSVPDLTRAIKQVLRSKNSSEIEFINRIVCERYNLNNREFLKGRTHGNRSDARQMAFCLLYFKFGYKQTKIAQEYGVSYRIPNLAISRFKKIDPSIKCDRDFKASYEILAEKTDVYINEKK